MGITYLYPAVSVTALPPAGGATAANQLTEITELQTISSKLTNGTQKTTITDGAGTVNTKQLGTALTNTDIGLVTNTTIHGLNSGGGGTYVDVKVNPAGKLLVEADVTASVLPTGAATEATLSALNTKVPANLTVTATRLLVDGSGVTQPISAASLPLPTGASTSANQTTTHTRLGDLTETAPATDTASSGLNGRLQRIAQRLTSLIALLPSSIGQKAKADSLSVTIATDQGALSVTPTNNSGTITNAQVTVGTSAVRATVSGSAPNAARKKLIIKSSKNNTGSIYLGSSSVTTANGLEIIGPDRLEFELDASDYYLISDTTAQVVEVLEVV